MPAFYIRLTDAGAAALVAAQTGDPIALTHFAVGDSNGALYDPTGAETALANERARVDVDAVEQDSEDPSILRVTAVLPIDVGGFTLREVGVFDATGDLFAIGKVAEIYKPLPAEGFALEMQLTALLAVGSTANVSVTVEGAAYATRNWVWSHQHFFAVKGATTPTPPGAPDIGDIWLLPAAAEDDWAGHDGEVAVWRGEAEGWLFVTPPNGALAQAADQAVTWRKTSTGWIVHDPAAHFAHANFI